MTHGEDRGVRRRCLAPGRARRWRRRPATGEGSGRRSGYPQEGMEHSSYTIAHAERLRRDMRPASQRVRGTLRFCRRRDFWPSRFARTKASSASRSRMSRRAMPPVGRHATPTLQVTGNDAAPAVNSAVQMRLAKPSGAGIRRGGVAPGEHDQKLLTAVPADRSAFRGPRPEGGGRTRAALRRPRVGRNSR